MHPDHKPYFRFTSRARLDRSINSLLGIIEGVAIDGAVNTTEVAFLRLWLDEQRELRNRHPYTELVPLVEGAVADGVLTGDERDDIVWLCEKLRSAEFYDRTTADLQRLHAVLGGIVADTRIAEDELRGLSDWLEEHHHLRTCWPYEEIGSLITSVLADKKIDEREHEMLHAFFAEFVALADGRTITNAPYLKDDAVVGLCAVDPQITFDGMGFCFTGASPRVSRAQFVGLVQER